MPDQFVLQFFNQNHATPGRLIKDFKVTEENVIPETVPADRDQMIITDSSLFDAIRAAYDLANGTADELIFTYDLEAQTVTW